MRITPTVLTFRIMNDGLIDGFRHSAWATRGLIDFCRQLSDEQLNAGAVGSFGSILATLKHMLGAEASYQFVFSGKFPAWNWRDEEAQPLEEIAPWVDDLAAFWEELLSKPFDAEVLLHQDFQTGESRDVRAGIVVAQALHHGTAHREQVATILTSLGFEPPDLDVWEYGMAVGRHTANPAPNAESND
jgi:uncharacterized damage-inducible protein DinB